MRPRSTSRQALELGLFGVGITACFVVYSVIQERLMTVGFGAQHEKFKHSMFIVLVNRVVTCLVAVAVLLFWDISLEPAAPVLLFAIPSLANVISSMASYEALKFVSFPLQALAKCAKTVRRCWHGSMYVSIVYRGCTGRPTA